MQLDENFFNETFKKTIDLSDDGAYDECYKKIKGLVNSGYSCPLNWERFKPLVYYDGFEAIRQKNEKLIKEGHENTAMEYHLDLPEDYSCTSEYPLFIVLHGDGSGSNIDEFRHKWSPSWLVKKNYICLYIQSSQFLYSFNYGWLNDPERARTDIVNAFETISKKHPIKRDSIIIAGFSGGAITALDITLSNSIPVKGFICISPVMEPESFSAENVKSANIRNVKGVFIEGEHEIPVQAEENMMRTFQKTGMAYRYFINGGSGHEIPKNLDHFLQEALMFIME